MFENKARYAFAVGLALTMAFSGAALPLSAHAEEPPADAAVSSRAGSEVEVSSTEELKAAFDNAPTDGTATTIRLTSDLVFSTADIVTVKSGQNVTFDMNGRSITVENDFSGRAFVVDAGGSLTVTGNGTIDATASVDDGLGSFDNYGTLTIESGTFCGSLQTSAANIRNQTGGTLTINGGTFDTNVTAVLSFEGSNTTINGGYFESPWYPAFENNGTATITGGEFVNTSCSTCDSAHWGYTIRNGLKSDAAYLRIEDATVTGTQGCVAIVGGTADIYGGTFQAVDCKESHGAVFYALYVAGESYKTSTTVYGGEFSSAKRWALYVGNSAGDGGNEEDATVVVKGGAFTGGDASKTAIKVDEKLGSIKISGGAYSSEPDQTWLAAGCDRIENADGTWTVGVEDPVASLDGVGYSTLQEAVNEAVRRGGTVTLLKDVTENITVAAGKEVTIDLAGFTLANTGDLANASGTITVEQGATLTLKDSSPDKIGTVDTTKHATGALVNHGTVTVEGGTFTRSAEASTSPSENGGNSWYVVDNQGTMTFEDGKVINDGKFSSLIRNLEGTLTVNGGTFENDFIAIKNDDGGILNITGGTITSGEQSVQNWNVANISGGTLNGLVATWDYSDSGNTSITTISGDAVINGDVRAVNYQNSNQPPTVKIEGGTINGTVQKGTHDGTSGTVLVDPTDDGSQISISGGTFSEAPSEELVVPGSGVHSNKDGSFGVHEHALTRVPAKDPTASTDGNIEHWRCTVCGDLFLDEEMTTPTTAEEVRIPATGQEASWTVTFDDCLASTDNLTVEVADGDLVAKPADPTCEGWKFLGWYTDTKLTQAYDFSSPVTSDLTLYAKWEQVAADPSGERPSGTLEQTGDATLLMTGAFAAVGVVALGAGAVVSRKRK